MSKTKIGEEQMSDEYYDLERRTEIKAASNRLKKQFLTWRECEIVYSLQHRKLLKYKMSRPNVQKGGADIFLDQLSFNVRY